MRLMEAGANQAAVREIRFDHGGSIEDGAIPRARAKVRVVKGGLDELGAPSLEGIFEPCPVALQDRSYVGSYAFHVLSDRSKFSRL
jgi:hypothetical protein